MDIFLTIVWFFFGAIIGSFLNVVIWRLPRQEGLGGRSHCPQCKHVLSWWELVPLFSFMLLGGKCGKCKLAISPRYLIIEGLTGLLYALSWRFFLPHLPLQYLFFAKSLLALSVFMVVFVVDLEHFLILDSVIFPASAAAAIMNLCADLISGQNLLSWHGYFISGLIGAAAAALPFFLLWFFSKGSWMGFGDVKLALFLGTIFGWPVVLANLMAAILLGGLVSVILLLGRQKTLKSRVPFGTFLSVAGVVALFYGERLLNWYLSLLGF